MELSLRCYDGACDAICRYIKVKYEEGKVKISMSVKNHDIEHELTPTESYSIVSFLSMLEEIRGKGESNG